jgi:phage FluMu protein Com
MSIHNKNCNCLNTHVAWDGKNIRCCSCGKLWESVDSDTQISNSKVVVCPKCKTSDYVKTSVLTFNWHCLRCDNVWPK